MAVTKELLEQYPDISREIEELEEQARTGTSDTVRGSSSSYPYTAHTIRISGSPVELQNRIAKLKQMKSEIEEAVNKLPNSSLRRLVTHRALYGEKWDDVAAFMGYPYSVGSCKAKYRSALRYMEK